MIKEIDSKVWINLRGNQTSQGAVRRKQANRGAVRSNQAGGREGGSFVGNQAGG